MQVEVIRTYTAKQPDELSLQVADVVLVSQAVEDGTSILSFLTFICFSPICSLLSCLFTQHTTVDFPFLPPTLVLGWYEGERLRDGERGWFLAECGEPITCPATIERNVQRMDRLKGLETNV